ncbi:MAG: hypothetical protein D3907_04120, partial [Candidatus Electrothrix sp. AUS3]|nr:hypothetical protein [Candidatus Electrothrix gigas]
RKEILKLLSQGILYYWNKDYTYSALCRPADILKNWLGYRIIGESGGRIPSFLEDICKLTLKDFSFSFLGNWYPNPYAYSIRSDLWPSDHKIKSIQGKGHGDLHGYNVLVKITGKHDYPYYLIDFALYEEQVYLFYDHAYLELSQLLHDRGTTSFQRWLQIIDAITGKNSSEVNDTDAYPDDVGLLQIVNTMRNATALWIKSKEPNRLDHIKGQTILARVAAGLNFVNKEMDNRQRQLSLLYAAAHLKQYLDFFHINWKPEGPVLTFDASMEVTNSDNWRSVWNDCDHFDPLKNTYVLVNGPGIRNTNPNQLEIIGRVPWSLILDFDPESEQGGLLSAARSVLQKYRSPRITLYDNVQDVNYREATCWFMASGVT